MFQKNSGSLFLPPAAWVWIVAMMACIGWSYFTGKDPNWDFGNYHLYLGRSAIFERWGQDFLPASIQSYLNPYSYVPVAAMVHWGWRDVVIASVLATIHSVNLLLIWLIAERLVAHRPRFRRTLCAVAVFLAALSPVFLQQIGGTFADAVTAIPALFGYYLLLCLKADVTQDRKLLLGAGLAFGVAVGLKLTNLPVAAGATLAVVFFCGPGWRARALATAFFALGGLLGVLAVHGYWGWRLYQEFGNPFYPFFNGIFHSPYYPDASIRHFRFTQDSLWTNITYLFRMGLPDREVYTEPAAPDVRVAAAAILLAALALTQVAARWSRAASARWSLTRQEGMFVTGFVLGAAIWLVGTANGRYAMPFLLLLGPLTVWLWIRLFPSVRWSTYGIGAVVLTQFGSVVLGADLRWNPNPWGNRWLEVKIPEKYVKEPFLFLTLEPFSQSYLVEYLHPRSAFVNVGGQYVLGPGVRGYERVQDLIRAHQGRVRMMVGIRNISTEGKPIIDLQDFGGTLARLGFQVDRSDCLGLNVREGIDRLNYMNEFGQDFRAVQDAALAKTGRGFALSCALMPLPESEVKRYQAEVAKMDPIFNRLEDLCPNLFRLRRPITEVITVDVAVRRYVESDVWLWVHDGQITYRPSRGDQAVELGTVADIMAAAQPRIDCTLRTGRSYSKDQYDLLKGLLK